MNLKGAAPEKFGAIKSFFYRLWAEPSVEPMHRRIAAEVPIEKGHLLDVGCGGGKLDHLIAAARPNVRVVGLDASEPMLRSARRRFVGSNVEFRLGMIEESGFSSEFDFALTVLSFHHWEEPEKGLAAVRRALVPGGRFWIYEMDPHAPEGAIRRDRGAVWGFLRMPVRMQRALSRDHGFTVAEVDTLVRPVVEKSGFGAFRIHRTGSTLRLELTNVASGDLTPNVASGDLTP
ncbi:MAG TPA: class I SAM-dependent methyltransferase [Thermoanaerobaculia bacterium]